MTTTEDSKNELKVGDKARISTTVTDTMISDFAKATGDFNPLHLDQSYAEKTIFKGRIAHGAFSIGLLSRVCTQFLGPGSVALSQELTFLAPVRPGDTITAMVEVIEVNREKHRVRIKTTCANQNGDLVVDGTAWGKPGKRLREGGYHGSPDYAVNNPGNKLGQ
jgi:3-hydroxybutyryl-CoA dehydratase